MYGVSSKQMYKNVSDRAVSSSYQKGNTRGVRKVRIIV